VKARILAIIPARGGSKGLPRKNLLPLAGKPLVAHSIEAALQCPLVTRTCVSTEDAEIAKIALEWGTERIQRPPELALDSVQNDDVVVHALEVMQAQGHTFDHVVLLQPTSPLRTAQHLEACLAAYLGSSASSTMSVCSVEHHPAKAIRIEAGRVVPFTNEKDMERQRQDLPMVFRQNGAIYGIGTADFLAVRRFYCPPCIPYVMAREDSIDIDERLDLELAEQRLRQRAAGEFRDRARPRTQ